MAYDEDLAERVRGAMATMPGVAEINMFGGLCWTIRGNMAVGIAKEELMVRMAPDDGEKALSRKHVRPMDFTGKPMRGFVFVAPQGLRTDRMLRDWVDRGVGFASSLPAKKPKSRSAR